MSSIIKVLLCAMITFSLLFCFASFSLAIEKTDIAVSYEIAIPADINFMINDVCTGHKTFIAADANEIGDFIIESGIDTEILKKDKSTSLSNSYIDIYNKDGKFICELIVDCGLNRTFAVINDRTVYVFLGEGRVLLYNIDTQKASCHQIIDMDYWWQYFYQRFDYDEFSVGDWKYECVNSFNGGYKELVRFDGSTEEVIFSVKRNSEDISEDIKESPFSIFSFSMCVAVGIYRFRRYKTKAANKNKKKFSIEGFYRVE